MSRLRVIKPDFWSSEQVMDMSPLSRLAFIGLWNFSDDRGVHPASPKTLKAELFPSDDMAAEQVAAMVAEMIHGGLVGEFESDGKRYWFVTGWAKHQRIDRPTYRHPMPPETRALAEKSTSDLREIDDTALRIRNTETEHGNNHRATPSHDASPKNRFPDFWETWPGSNRKVAKAKCADIWKRRKLDSIADTIISHVNLMKETDQWRTGFEPAPMTYLNQQRWLDGASEPSRPAQNWI